ncbi:hypothetical protein [Burkholderia metallica]|uniref:hypothetical protein n=1 Tax=Burkholderia metallica TaxID=488729 RepID=UPI00158E6D1C|nr:hypothetical protein [Burkholderia metallica]
MSEADDRLVLATLARLKRVRAMRSQIARVAAARQQGIAAQSRRALAAAHAQLAQQVAAKAAIQTRLADDVREARALQDAAADTRTFDRQIGTANASVNEAAHVHRGHEATLADLQRAARKAQAAEDKLGKAGEKALHARAARVERDADEVADGHAVRRFATAGVWAAVGADASGHGAAASGAAQAFDAEMTAPRADTRADRDDTDDPSDPSDPNDPAASAADGAGDDPPDIATPATLERRC